MSLTSFKSNLSNATEIVPVVADRVRLINVAGDTHISEAKRCCVSRREVVATGACLTPHRRDRSDLGVRRVALQRQ